MGCVNTDIININPDDDIFEDIDDDYYYNINEDENIININYNIYNIYYIYYYNNIINNIIIDLEDINI